MAYFVLMGIGQPLLVSIIGLVVLENFAKRHSSLVFSFLILSFTLGFILSLILPFIINQRISDIKIHSNSNFDNFD